MPRHAWLDRKRKQPMKKFYQQYMLNNIPFHIFSITSIGLIVASFIVPPIGVIDGSVLAAVGEMCGFAALWAIIKAMDKGIDATFTKGDMSVTLDNEKKDES